ncbi:hypothetical protein DFH27DRAFT_571610 [Peziza echinospora]|nr:hypothetical protein DFH27DRAFT_571610 [Peziza echinospora]
MSPIFFSMVSDSCVLVFEPLMFFFFFLFFIRVVVFFGCDCWFEPVSFRRGIGLVVPVDDTFVVGWLVGWLVDVDVY